MGNGRRRRQLTRHPEVAKPDGAVCGEEEIHGLDVPVQHLQRVKVLQPAQRLAVHPPDLCLREQRPVAPAEHAVHISTFAQLHDDVQPAGFDEALHVAHHVRVVHRRQQLHFAQHRRLLRWRQVVKAFDPLQRARLLIGHATHAEDGAVGAGAKLALEAEVGADRHGLSQRKSCLAAPSPPPACGWRQPPSATASPS
jgi:hypothetical protein